MIHPDDSTLVITPPVSREHTGIWLNKLITNAGLFASLGAWCIFGLIAAGLIIRIAVGDFVFRVSSTYLGLVTFSLGIVIGLIIWYAMTLELPPYVPRWQVKEPPSREDPYDEIADSWWK